MTTRRNFVKALAAQGAILMIPIGACRQQELLQWTPNEWLTIDSAGVVTLVLHKAEMGQGVDSAIPMLVAEELGVDWSTIRCETPQPSDRYEMGTSGSGSITDVWLSHRQAAAAAREMLVAAAATKWGVSPGSCEVRDGSVFNGRQRATFGALVPVARALPIPTEPRLRERSSYRLLGTVAKGPANRAIVTGAQRFGSDIVVPGMLRAVVARPPAHGGRVASVDDTAARQVPGVTRIVNIESAVAVVAHDTWAALKGKEALRVTWSEGTHPSFSNAEGWSQLEASMRTKAKVARESGNSTQGLARAARRVHAEYRWTWQAHAAIEPLNCIVHVTTGRCEVWVGTQNANRAREGVAQVLGLKPEQVVIHSQRLGGGFGRRIAADFVVEAAQIARTVGAPVFVQWSREDDFQHDFYNPAQINRLHIGIDNEGAVTAWQHDVGDFNLTMFGEFSPNNNPKEDGDPWGGIDSPYEVRDTRVTLALTETRVPTGAWRSVAYPGAVLARECALDEVARATGQDPVALRLALIPSPGNIVRGEVTRPNGDRLRRVVSEAAARASWGTPITPRNPQHRAGRGFACNSYHAGTMVAQVADVEVTPEGEIIVRRLLSVVECGLAINKAGVEKQFEGGVAWALTALFGPGVSFDRGGTTTQSYAQYPVVTMREMPQIETHILASEFRPFGIGEPPVPAVAPAVLNAVFDATGVRLRSLPLDRSLLRRSSSG